jgi:hypothetical protein
MFRSFSVIFKEVAINVFFFVEYLPEDGWKRSKYVGGIAQVVYHCI